MKTNFEKWRDSLTPEKVNEFREACEMRTACDRCPSIAFCGKTSGFTCAEAFTTWANAPAKEEK